MLALLVNLLMRYFYITIKTSFYAKWINFMSFYYLTLIMTALIIVVKIKVIGNKVTIYCIH